MKTLQTIHNTFRVFHILTKIAFIFSVVGASICALGAACAMTWFNGGHVFSLFGQPIPAFAEGVELQRAYAVLLSDMVYLPARIFRYGSRDAAGPGGGAASQVWHVLIRPEPRRRYCDESDLPLC